MFSGKQSKGQDVAISIVVDFLKKTMPFNDLDDATLKNLARNCRVDFYPKGTRLLTADQSELPYLYLIQRGGVKSYLTDDEGQTTLKDYLGEGAYVGALGIIRGTRANFNVDAVEDTFCFLMPRQIFLDLIEKQTGVAQFYLKNFSEKIVHTAYNELRQHRMPRRTSEDLYLFNVTAGDIIKSKPAKVAATVAVQEAAKEMSRLRVGSLLIHEPDDPENIVGIITDRDLRAKVVAAGTSYAAPVMEIMSSSIQTVHAETICFDVLLQMMANGIHHLPVVKDGRVVGVVTSHDIMLLQGYSPYLLFKEIVAQQKIGGLYPLSQKIPEMARNLIREGAKSGNVTRMIAILNDHILNRLLTLLEEEMGPPPVRYCWLLLGSEGRREQTLKTDQDNAIIYEDTDDDEKKKKAQAYFAEFARRAIEHLVACGYPLCPGKMMANNPLWCQPYSVWANYFESWISAPDPEELLNASIFFDFRPGFGDLSLAVDLRSHLNQFSSRNEIYLLHMAHDCMADRAPLSFFKNFIVEKDGEHKNKLDLKRRGLQPFVCFARVLALKYGISETNTLSRIKMLAEKKHISQDLLTAVTHAYEMQMHLRLIHQLRRLDENTMPDNYIDPKELSDLDKRILRDSFTVIDRLHNHLSVVFPVG